jgi:hypothetical protein
MEMSPKANRLPKGITNCYHWMAILHREGMYSLRIDDYLFDKGALRTVEHRRFARHRPDFRERIPG